LALGLDAVGVVLGVRGVFGLAKAEKAAGTLAESAAAGARSAKAAAEAATAARETAQAARDAAAGTLAGIQTSGRLSRFTSWVTGTTRDAEAAMKVASDGLVQAGGAEQKAIQAAQAAQQTAHSARQALPITGIGLAPAIGAWMIWQVSRRDGPGLTLRVCPDALTMSRNGKVTYTIARGEVGFIGGARQAGVRDITVYGRDRQVVGRWETNWWKGPIRIMRALKACAYPWVDDDATYRAGPSKHLRSQSAPAWTDEVLRT